MAITINVTPLASGELVATSVDSSVTLNVASGIGPVGANAALIGGSGIDVTYANGEATIDLNATLASLSDVSALAPAAGQVLEWNGTAWATGSGGGLAWISPPPGNSTDAGNAGDVAYDSSFFYLHTGSEWLRAQLTAFGAAAGSITITSQPQNLALAVGGSGNLTVAASVSSGATPSYQWQDSSDNGATWASLNGATGSSYGLSNVALADNGTLYRAVVSALGASSVTSDSATLTVAAVPSQPTNVTVTVQQASVAVSNGTQSLWLDFDGPVGSTQFTDSSSYEHTITSSGNVSVSATQSRFGGESAYFDTGGGTILLPADDSLTFGVSDFTVEFWYYDEAISANDTNLFLVGSGLEAGGFGVRLTRTNLDPLQVRLAITNGGGAITAGIDQPVGRWVHFAATRQDGVFRMWIDGEMRAESGTLSVDFTRPIQAIGSNIGSGYWSGWIDRFVATKGLALYESNFTPPASLEGGTPSLFVGSYLNGDAAGDKMGSAVALSDSGYRVAVGAEYNDAGGAVAGQVRVWDADGSTWSQIGQDILGATAGDNTGSQVSLSADGSVLAVVSSQSSSNSDGYVKVYDLVSGTWTQRGTQQVAMAAVLSANGDSLATHDGSTASVYDWSGSAWVLRGASFASLGPGTLFRSAIAASSNCNVVAVGSPYVDSVVPDDGVTQVFAWDGAAWTAMGSAIVGDGADQLRGYSVALSDNGFTLAVGAPGDEFGTAPGYVYVYDWSGSAWVQRGPALTEGTAGGASGWSVSLNSVGSLVAFGSRLGSGTRIYRWNGDAWSLVVSTSPDSEQIALNAAGDLWVIGDTENNRALAYQYT